MSRYKDTGTEVGQTDSGLFLINGGQRGHGERHKKISSKKRRRASGITGRRVTLPTGESVQVWEFPTKANPRKR